MDTQSNQALQTHAEPPRPSESSPSPTSDSRSPNDFEARQENRRRREAWGQSGFFPLHMAGCAKVESWPQPAFRDLAYETVANNGLAVLIGPRGTGKTQLACCVAREFVYATGHSARYMRAHDYFTDIKRSFESDDADPRKKARHTYLLVLDECQERYETAFEDIELTSLIDHRYGHRRPTVLIANLTAEGLAKGLGSSIVSRIQENGVVIPCTWPSFRGAKT